MTNPDTIPARGGRRGAGQVALVAVATLAVLAAVAASPFMVYAGYAAFTRHRFYAGTPIVADLPGSEAEAEQEFAARVARAFPVGMPVDRMAEALRRQGFEPAEGRDGSGAALEAELSGSGCRVTWDVLWTADGSGRIASIAGRQARACA